MNQPLRLLCLLLLAGASILPTGSAQEQPQLFGTTWEDLSQFGVDLQDEYLERALALEHAPVYHLQWRFDGPTELQALQEVRVANYSDVEWHRLHFHLHPNLLGARLQVESALVDGRPARQELHDSGGLLTLGMHEPLPPGAAVTVTFDYDLEFRSAVGRNYGILGYRQGILSLPHGYPLLAVHRDGAWDLDLPDRRGDMAHAVASFYRVRVDVPAGIDLVATGRTTGWRREGDRQIREFTAGPVRDFYLAAGEEFDPLIAYASGTFIRGFAEFDSIPGMEEALEHTVAALEFMTERYGPYPYRELELVPISTSALGVEFPGVIALRRQLFSGADRSRLLESTVVHEVIHQWFYGLVGNDQLSEPWLDESLTQYLTLRYYLWRHGSGGYRAFRQDLLARWDQLDRSVQPVGLPVDAYDAVQYNALVYGLGPLVIEWLADRLGRPEFDAFLHEYAQRFSFRLARTGDFREGLEEACDCSLEGFFARWIAGGAAGGGDPVR